MVKEVIIPSTSLTCMVECLSFFDLRIMIAILLFTNLAYA